MKDDFKSSFFGHNHKHRAEVGLQSLRQTGTVSAYAQEFNSHTHTVGWANTPLMSLYQHGLKENIQLAMVMSKIQFNSLRNMQAMTLKAGQTIEGIQNGRTAPIPPASTSSPTTDPNAMDLSAFQCGGPHNQLSDAKRNCRLQLKLCFCCGQAGHVSCGCSNGKRKSQNQQDPRQPQLHQPFPNP
ncbi:uncharacterized protein VP01_2088g2 [Puccinia sorghi]|uniref:CCHC-type domain-containing protein n=1 Tax=Puccinia sorghi TaxID=27349 RepID=A0A0L6VAE8_9BASI|nr:uncharacterized protein VP01_2088g2 [Puccinia sorghi]